MAAKKNFFFAAALILFLGSCQVNAVQQPVATEIPATSYFEADCF